MEEFSGPGPCKRLENQLLEDDDGDAQRLVQRDDASDFLDKVKCDVCRKLIRKIDAKRNLGYMKERAGDATLCRDCVAKKGYDNDQ